MPATDILHGDLARNSRIANALLEVLADAGQVGRRSRALRAVGVEGGGLRSSESWLSTPNFAAMLRAAEVDAKLARRVGQWLVRTNAVGLALCYGGLATPEKAYRRAQMLLARECEGGRYEPREIDAQRGRILFHPPARGNAERFDDALGQLMCACRVGMLEAVPLLFGLLPARVRERECAFAGSERCVFEVSWTRSVRIGTAIGAGGGALLGGALVATSSVLGLALTPALAVAGGLTLLLAAIGRSIDLTRQLEAVAGARRGQLALLDQVDASLAEKMDALARADGPRESARITRREPEPDEAMQGLVPSGRRPAAGTAAGEHGGDTGPATSEVASLASLRAVTAELRQKLAALHDALGVDGKEGAADAADSEADGAATPDAPSTALLRDCAAHGRRIEALAAELDRHGREADRTAVDLATLIARAVAALRPELPAGLDLDVELATGAPRVVCDAFQIEYVIEQLVRNAAEASPEGGRIRIALADTPEGVEISVSDQGEGLEHAKVDELFDPFEGERPAGQDGGFGLPVCFRIAEEHGGELRVQSASDAGTRISLVLPQAAPGG